MKELEFEFKFVKNEKDETKKFKKRLDKLRCGDMFVFKNDKKSVFIFLCKNEKDQFAIYCINRAQANVVPSYYGFVKINLLQKAPEKMN